MKNKIHNFDSFVKSDYAVNEGAFLNEGDRIDTKSPAPQFIRDVDAPEVIKKVKTLYKSTLMWKGDRKEANKPIFIYGAPGIGKTRLVQQAAKELGIKLLNLDLQYMSPEDFIGIPKVVPLTKEDIQKKTASYETLPPDKRIGKVEPGEWPQMTGVAFRGQGVTRGNPPLVLPRSNMENGKGGILFMDEGNRAKPRVLNALMQFVQEGRLGDYNLPSCWVIVAAGNRPSEADVATFDYALADRFDIVNYDPKPKDWVDWAKREASSTETKWPMEIISYLQKNPVQLHNLDTDFLRQADDMGMGAKFRTHRSWTAAMDTIQNAVKAQGKKSWKDLDFEEVMKIIQLKVGLDAMSEIRSYLNTLKQFTETELRQIFTDPENAKMLPRKIEGDPSYSLLTTLYGLYGIVTKELVDEQGSSPPVKSLYNIVSYFNRYNQHEMMTSLYQKMKQQFKNLDLKRNSDLLNVLKNPSDPGHEDAKLVLAIAKMVGEAMPPGLMPSSTKQQYL